jgi:hypothetical protein
VFDVGSDLCSHAPGQNLDPRSRILSAVSVQVLAVEGILDGARTVLRLVRRLGQVNS